LCENLKINRSLFFLPLIYTQCSTRPIFNLERKIWVIFYTEDYAYNFLYSIFLRDFKLFFIIKILILFVKKYIYEFFKKIVEKLFELFIEQKKPIFHLDFTV